VEALMESKLDQVREVMAAGEEIDLDGVDLPFDPGPPSEPPPPEDAPPDGPDDSGPDGERIERAAAEPLNDYGNGRRFAIHYGDGVIWVPRVGWHVWCGTHWKRDDDMIEVRRRAQQLTFLVEKETAYIKPTKREAVLLSEERQLEKRRRVIEETDPDARSEEEKAELGGIMGRLKAIEITLKEHKSLIGRRLTHAKNAGNSNAIDHAITESGIELSRTVEQLDCRHLDVNTLSGVLRFSVDGGPGTGFSRTARVDLLAHDRDHLVTKVMPVAYDPTARSDLWDTFLERVQPIPAMRSFLQRWLGYSMTGLTNEQKLAFFYGSGSNGKSVLVDVIARLLGAYAATAKIESLTGKNRRSGGDATPDLVPLIGARFVRASEPEQGERLQEGKIKELTGGEPILVRALNADFVEVLPRFKMTISGNHKPEVRGTDDGIWRRLLLVPFDVQIPAEERDPLLVEKLVAEGPAILNWLIHGLLSYLEDGLQEPDAVLAATAEYRSESDPMGAFLADRCQVTGRPDDWISTADLVAGFNLHAALEGISGWKERTIAYALRDKADKWRHPRDGLTFRAQKRSVSGYGGIRWTDFFAKTLRDAPKDHNGRPMAPSVGADDMPEGF
jgi:putative DNA primase/helicase